MFEGLHNLHIQQQSIKLKICMPERTSFVIVDDEMGPKWSKYEALKI